VECYQTFRIFVADGQTNRQTEGNESDNFDKPLFIVDLTLETRRCIID